MISVHSGYQGVVVKRDDVVNLKQEQNAVINIMKCRDSILGKLRDQSMKIRGKQLDQFYNELVDDGGFKLKYNSKQGSNAILHARNQGIHDIRYKQFYQFYNELVDDGGFKLKSDAKPYRDSILNKLRIQSMRTRGKYACYEIIDGESVLQFDAKIEMDGTLKNATVYLSEYGRLGIKIFTPVATPLDISHAEERIRRSKRDFDYYDRAYPWDISPDQERIRIRRMNHYEPTLMINLMYAREEIPLVEFPLVKLLWIKRISPNVKQNTMLLFTAERPYQLTFDRSDKGNNWFDRVNEYVREVHEIPDVPPNQSVWALSDDGTVYFSPPAPSFVSDHSKRAWLPIQGNFIQIAAGPRSIVWGVAPDSNLYCFTRGYGGGISHWMGEHLENFSVQKHFQCTENERYKLLSGFQPHSGRGRMSPWVDQLGYSIESEIQYRLPDLFSWHWIGDWSVKNSSDNDPEGWYYAKNFDSSFSATPGRGVRKRHHVRLAQMDCAAPWTKVPVNLVKIARVTLELHCFKTGNELVAAWALCANGNLLYRHGVTPNKPQGEEWVHVDIDRPLVDVSLDAFCHLWVVCSDGSAYLRMGISEQVPIGNRWMHIGKPDRDHLVRIAAGKHAVWALGSTGNCYIRTEYGACWSLVDSEPMCSISVSGSDQVFGITEGNRNVVSRDGVSGDKLEGDKWSRVLEDVWSDICITATTQQHHWAQDGHLEPTNIASGSGRSHGRPVFDEHDETSPMMTQAAYELRQRNEASPPPIDRGETLLHDICRNNKTDELKRMLDINVADSSGRTLLYTAVRSDAAEIVDILLEVEGIDLEGQIDQDSTPLILATKMVYNSIVEKLLKAGAQVNAIDSYGRTALHWAAEICNMQAMELLLSHGANKDAESIRKETPLFLATREGKLEAVKFLVLHNAHRHLADSMDQTPIDVARDLLHSDIEQVLLTCNTDGDTVLKKQHVQLPGCLAPPPSDDTVTGSPNALSTLPLTSTYYSCLPTGSSQTVALASALSVNLLEFALRDRDDMRGYEIKEYKLRMFDPTAIDCHNRRGVWSENSSITLKIKKSSFASGAFRDVYLATDDSTSKKYVVKRFKSNIKSLMKNEGKDIGAQARITVQETSGIASYLAIKFNSISNQTQMLKYLSVSLSEEVNLYSKEVEPVFIEEFVDSGNEFFKKYIGNNGELATNTPPKEQELCETFVHYTLQQMKGKLMVCDIQGWFPLLCDPAIATWDKKPGDDYTFSNISRVAIERFAQLHNCSNLCTNILKLDKVNELISRLPR